MNNQDKIKEQQRIAISVFDLAKSHGIEEVVLAGGAPRDWYFGNPANDLDFYLSNTPADFLTDVFKLSSTFDTLTLGSDTNDLMEIDESYNRNPNISQITEVTIQGQKIQLIEHLAPEKVLKEFVYSLCQIEWKPDGTFNKTKVFQTSIDHKFNIRTGKGYSNYRKYAHKIRKKFPDYPLVSKSKAFNIMAGLE